MSVDPKTATAAEMLGALHEAQAARLAHCEEMLTVSHAWAEGRSEFERAALHASPELAQVRQDAEDARRWLATIDALGPEPDEREAAVLLFRFAALDLQGSQA